MSTIPNEDAPQKPVPPLATGCQLTSHRTHDGRALIAMTFSDRSGPLCDVLMSPLEVQKMVCDMLMAAIAAQETQDVEGSPKKR